MATRLLFPESPSSQIKGCPRGAFLGLCEEGPVKGIPTGSYTKSAKNKLYAITAIRLLESGAIAVTPLELWDLVMPRKNISHNSQMDVVLALWDRGLIA